jgi:hypothetical protein
VEVEVVVERVTLMLEEELEDIEHHFLEEQN